MNELMISVVCTIRSRCVIAVAMVLVTAQAPSGLQDSAIVPPGVSLEKLFDGAEFTEGPAVGGDGYVYFSDLTFASSPHREDGHIWRYDPRTLSCSIFRSPSSMSNGIDFDASGSMVMTQGSNVGGRGLARIDLSTGKGEILVHHFGGMPLNSPNDLIIDSKNRIFFTDPRYGDTRSAVQPVNGVYRLDPDGKLVLIISDIPMPNGIALSPDERLLYVGCYDERPDSSDGKIPLAPRNFVAGYQLTAEGFVKSPQMLVVFSSEKGPDGIAVDKAGHIYVALRDDMNPGVAVYSPKGERIAWIKMPEVPSNVAFSRPPDDSLLYITAGHSLYRIRTTQHGFFSTSRQR